MRGDIPDSEFDLETDFNETLQSIRQNVSADFMKKFIVYYVKKYFKAQLAGGYLHINCVFFKEHIKMAIE